MKKEASKKSIKWLWLVIGIVVLVAALAVGAFLLFGPGASGPEVLSAAGLSSTGMWTD